MNVIGKATLNWEKYTEYVQRETINVKEHPEDSWYLDIRYKVPHEVEAIVWNCMRKIGELKNGPIAIPNEEIVEEIKKHQEYLLSIAAKWEMLFYAENVAVLRSGSLTVAVPADTVETEVYANMEHIPFGQLKRQLTTDNYDQKKKELEDSLDQMAEEHQMNRKDFYEKYYDMTEEDTEAFVKKQAEKLTESSDDVSEQAQGSEKQ